MLAHAQSRLNEWWPATIVGLLAALLLGQTDGNAQTSRPAGISLAPSDAVRVADRMASDSPAWRQDLRNYVERTTDRRAIVDRTKVVLSAYRDRCEDSCSAETVRQIVQVASGAACAAGIVPVSIDPGFVPPRGTYGFDFQPRGARTANGFRPVVPGDPRMIGGSRPVAGATKQDLSADALADVRRFRAEQLPDGDYRVIVLGAGDGAGAGNPFGAQVTINGRSIDVARGSSGVAAGLGGAARNVQVAGRAQAPMLVVDLTISGGVLEIQFPQGAVVSGMLFEPAGNRSVLDMSVAGNAIASTGSCMSATTELQEAASDGVVAQRNRVSDLYSQISSSGLSGGSSTGGGLSITGGGLTRVSGGGGNLSPNYAAPLSGN